MSVDQSRRARLAILSIAVPLAGACTGEIEPSLASLSDEELIDIVEQAPDIELTSQALADRGCAASGAWSIDRDSVWGDTVLLVREGVCTEAGPDQQQRSMLIAFVVDEPRGAIGYGMFSDAIEVVDDPTTGASHFEREDFFLAYAEGELTERTLTEDAAILNEASVGTTSAPLTDVGASAAAVCGTNDVAKALFHGYQTAADNYGGGCPGMTNCSDCRAAVTATNNEITRLEGEQGQAGAMRQLMQVGLGVPFVADFCGTLSLELEVACRARNTIACLQQKVIEAGDNQGAGCMAATRYMVTQYFKIRAAQAAENNPRGTWQWWLCSNRLYAPTLCEPNCHGAQGSCAGNIGGGSNNCLAEEIDGDGDPNGQVPCCTLLCDSFCLNGDEAGSEDGWSNDDTADPAMCVDLSGG